MGLNVKTGPTVEPVTLTELKRFVRRKDDREDGWIEQQLIPAARKHGEAVKTWRTFITTSWKLTLDAFSSIIELPRPPLQSVTSIKYLDIDGVQQTLDSGVYQVSTDREPGTVQPAHGESWPSYRSVPDTIEIIYKAGYGDAASDVPPGLRTAVLQLAAHWHQNRDAVVTGTIATRVPWIIDALFDEYSLKAMA